MESYQLYMQLVHQGRLSLNQAIERINREEAVIKGVYDKYSDKKFLAEILRKDKYLARRFRDFQFSENKSQ